MANTLVFHGCGGCGINALDFISNRLDALGEGFAKPKYLYIDTSRANIDKIQPKGEFWLVKTKAHSKMEITGSGGERAFNANDSMANVKEYLDTNNFIKRNPNEFHVVISSASGGSGGTVGHFIIKELITRGIPVVSVVIGDSSNGLNAKNTLNTIASLDRLAKTTAKPISVIYINNHLFVKEDVSMRQAEETVNKILSNILSTLSLFLSGENEALDNQDMFGIIDQSHYTTINVLPGLYSLMIHSNKVEVPAGNTPSVGRTLTIEGHDFDTSIALLHHKRGYVVNPNAISVMKEGCFPIHLIAYANGLVKEVKTLKNISDEYDSIAASMQNEDLFGTANSNVDDETGLVF